MNSRGLCSMISILAVMLFAHDLLAQSNGPASSTLQLKTQLVTLDATVLDARGHIVTAPLLRDDFKITEDKLPQTINTFETATAHLAAGADQDSPLVIIVLDELNYEYHHEHTNGWNTAQQLSEQVYERHELAAYLEAQTERLGNRTEVLALTHHGFRVLASPTRDRSSLLEVVQRHDPGLGSAFRDYLEETGAGGVADHTLTRDSLQAVWSLALAERATPGRKLVLWLGRGGPGGFAGSIPDAKSLSPFDRYVREVTDLLVDARITIDLIAPGIDDGSNDPAAVGTQIVNYPYERDFGFSGYVQVSGGQWRRGNDVRGEIQASVNYGSVYYTMTYRPKEMRPDAEFRHIRVTVKGHPNWTVLTKAGYYAMPSEPQTPTQAPTDLNIAAFEPLPFSAVGVRLVRVERVQGSDAARFTFALDAADLTWLADTVTGKQRADVTLTGAALGSVFAAKTMASKNSTWALAVPSGTSLGMVRSTISLILAVPAHTKRLRFIVQDVASSGLGTLDLSPVEVASAPEIVLTKAAQEVRPGKVETPTKQ